MSREELHRQGFRDEAHDLLAELEEALLTLEAVPTDTELIGRVFRAMHTIKGSGAMFGFERIAAFTHEIETVFDLVRNGRVGITKDLLDLTLAARDRIRDMLDEDGGDAAGEARSEDILRGFRAYLPAAGKTAAPSPDLAAPDPAAGEAARVEQVWHIRFRPARTIFLAGGNPAGLLGELGELGEARVVGHAEDVPEFSELEPELCYLWWDVLLRTAAGELAIRDVFMFVEDESLIEVGLVAESGEELDEDGYRRLGEILVARGDLSPRNLEEALRGQKKLGSILTESGLVSRENVDSALAEQDAVRELKSEKRKDEAQTTIRVPAEKLDNLVDLVGELVIVQARIRQAAERSTDAVLGNLSEELELLSDSLRDATLNIRMLPIGTTFNRFQRLVRDLSAELGKSIKLLTKGGETELDKTVLDQLNDPLVHLLRNAIDHGIESPEVREAKGKPRTGTIELSAEHSGGEVLVRVTDDGKGLNREAIRAKGLERGLITPESQLSDKELMSLIFSPGFSTAQAITSVSGRGVGMDVVKRCIDSLRGSIDIESTVGTGTTITVKLPLTLAIIEGLQVRVGGEYFVVPLAMVEECVELEHSREETGRRRFIASRGEMVPYIRIRDWFAVPGTAPAIEQIVIAHLASGRLGLAVDQVIGEHQTVIKSLGRIYREVEGLSGATVRGDGSLALILDVPSLYRSVLSHRNRIAAAGA